MADDLDRRAERASRETDKLHAKMRRYERDVLAIAGAVVTLAVLGPDQAAMMTTEPLWVAGAVEPRLSESLHRKLTAHRTNPAMLTSHSLPWFTHCCSYS